MTADVKEKPQLHQSHLSMLYRCGYQFFRVVIQGDKEPPAIPQVIGKAAHETVALNYTRKIQKETITKEEITDYAADFFDVQWGEAPVVLSEDEQAAGLEKTKANAKDKTILAALAHFEHIAPNVNPAEDGVEWKWVIECSGYPFDLAGQCDVREVDGSVRDNKFRNRRISQAEVDRSEQLTVYSMASYIITGVMPPKVWLDGVSSGKTKISYDSVSSTRTESDFTIFRNRFEAAVEVIEKGAYTPASPTDWWCSDRFCGFAADGSCPYYNSGRKTFAPAKRRPAHKALTNGSRLIKKNTEEWTNAVR